MDEEISIINQNTRYEKIKNFFFENKKRILAILLLLVFCLISYFGFQEINKRNKIKIANDFNKLLIEHTNENDEKIIEEMINIINEKDRTYSPLALYYLIDKNLINEKKKLNELFDILIDDTNIEKEIKNLLIYKKALSNADNLDENSLIQMLNPIINSESVWKSHALYLLAEFFYSKDQNEKSKEFFNKIISLPSGNLDIKRESQKRLNRDFSE